MDNLEENQRKKSKKKTKISIIIPTLNEEKYLPTLLKSIQAQNFSNYEIIVADSSSTDQTVKVAESYGAKIVAGGKPAVGRNNGANAATGDFLFFLDADVKLPKHFLQNALKEINERFLDLATCAFIPMSSLRFDKVLHDFTNLFIKVSQFSNSPHARGACIIVSKRLFERVNGFNEDLRLSEDHDFVQRASLFRPLRVLRTTAVKLSVRRLEKEGRLGIMKKYLNSYLNSISSGLIPEAEEYDFAQYDNMKKRKFDEQLIQFEQKIDELNNRYHKILTTNIKIDPFEKDDSQERTDLTGIRQSLQKEIQSLVDLFRKTN